MNHDYRAIGHSVLPPYWHRGTLVARLATNVVFAEFALCRQINITIKGLPRSEIAVRLQNQAEKNFCQFCNFFFLTTSRISAISDSAIFDIWASRWDKGNHGFSLRALLII